MRLLGGLSAFAPRRRRRRLGAPVGRSRPQLGRDRDRRDGAALRHRRVVRIRRPRRRGVLQVRERARRRERRKITYKFVDDQYNPAQTVQATRELVQQERVFAIFNSLGTEHNLAVRSYLNAAKVPQLFVGSGATTFGRDYRRYPQTIGFLPSYVGEGKVYARHILKTRPTAKIAVLYQNDDYGKDLLNGFKAGLGAKRRNIVAEQSYDPLSTDVSSQMARLKGSGAKVLMVIATPPFAIRGLVAANRLGWRPQVYVNQVGSATNIMRIISTTAGPRIIQNAITLISVKDPTSPRFRRDKGMALYRTIMRRYLPRADVNDGFHVYSMAVAYTFVEALKKAGRNPTRASLLRAVANLNIRSNPFLLPGVASRRARRTTSRSTRGSSSAGRRTSGTRSAP